MRARLWKVRVRRGVSLELLLTNDDGVRRTRGGMV